MVSPIEELPSESLCLRTQTAGLADSRIDELRPTQTLTRSRQPSSQRLKRRSHRASPPFVLAPPSSTASGRGSLVQQKSCCDFWLVVTPSLKRDFFARLKVTPHFIALWKDYLEGLSSAWRAGLLCNARYLVMNQFCDAGVHSARSNAATPSADPEML